MEGEKEEIDFDRWYRELFKKFTIVRDAIEIYNRGDHGLIKEMETWLYFIRFWKNKTREKYEDASNFINQAFETCFTK